MYRKRREGGIMVGDVGNMESEVRKFALSQEEILYAITHYLARLHKLDKGCELTPFINFVVDTYKPADNQILAEVTLNIKKQP